jgi:putative salt-induced outer membrane protein YdiY
MRYGVLVLVLSLAVMANSVCGDEIILKNGNRLTGTVKQLVDGKLVFESELAGTLTIDMSNVQAISSDAPIEVHLSDGTVLQETVSKSKPGQFSVAGKDASEAREFDIAAIASINPPEKPKAKWSGSLSIGATSTHGNTKTESISVGFKLGRRTEKDRTQLSADYGRGETEDPITGVKTTTEDWLRTKAKYDYFFSKKMYGYLDGRYERDSIAALDRRIIGGGGAGYQWIESEKSKFSTEAGVAYRYEKYDNHIGSKDTISGQFGYNLEEALLENVKLLHDLTYYPSLEELSDYLLSSSAELRANFTKNMFVNFKIIFSYDATPALGKQGTDTKYILGVGIDF